MSYDAAYLAASMIDAKTPWYLYCTTQKLGDNHIVWIKNEENKYVDCVTTVEYAIHLYHGKAMI